MGGYLLDFVGFRTQHQEPIDDIADREHMLQLVVQYLSPKTNLANIRQSIFIPWSS